MDFNIELRMSWNSKRYVQAVIVYALKHNVSKSHSLHTPVDSPRVIMDRGQEADTT